MSEKFLDNIISLDNFDSQTEKEVKEMDSEKNKRSLQESEKSEKPDEESSETSKTTEEKSEANEEENYESNEEDDEKDEKEPSDEETSEDSETAETTEPDEEKSVFEYLDEKLGYEISTSDKFDEDDESSYVKYINEAAKKQAEEQVNKELEIHPELKKLHNYIKAGGDADQYFRTMQPEKNYSELEVKDNTDLQKEVIRDFYKEQGFEDKQIKDIVKDYENTGILEKQASIYKNSLANKQQKEQQQLVERQKEQQKQEQKQFEQYLQQAQNLLQSKNDFSGVTIPEKEKSTLIEELKTPSESNPNITKAVERFQNMSDEEMFAHLYLLKHGTDKVIGRKSKTAFTKKVKGAMKPKKQSNKEQPKDQTKGSVDEIDTSEIFGN